MTMPTDRPEAALPVGRTAFAGAIQTGLSQIVRAALTIASTVVLARLLTPGDFGVIAMAAPVLVFVLLFQDLGLSAATIQAREVSAAQSSTLFWIVLFGSAAIALLMAAAAPLVAWFYRDARVGEVAAASGLIVLVTGAALQHSALLARELRFGALAVIVAASAVVAFAATIAFALWLRSYWAIFLGNLAGACAQSAATWSVQRWRPGRRASLRETAAMLRFGGSVAGFDLLNFFSRYMDYILIGRSWGAGPLGLYDRSYSLMVAPLQIVRAPVARVMLPVMSRLIDSPERYRNAYLSSLRALLLVTAPAAAIAIAASEPLILLLLGEAWRGAAPIFFWLAIGCLYLPLASSTGLLFVSTGRGRSLMLWGLFASVTTVAAFVAGLPWGPVGVAKAYVAATVLQTLIVIPWASRGTPVRAADVFLLFAPFLVAALGVGLMVRWLSSLLPPLALIAASVPPAYLATLLLLWLFPDGPAFLRSTGAMVRAMVARRGGSGSAADAEA